MVYGVPKCECGTELTYAEFRLQERIYKIKSDGTPFKKPLRIFDGDSQHSSLYCQKCGNSYSIDSYSAVN
ncbi:MULTISPECIES: hypothetical protein [Sporosarcina]|uniref:Uncharacterized protein YbaR (Trm112 family) n=1 Tax=Sporosarcina psychrophila TaxID=1476 RepID=A0ABV2KAM9_SPOPS|nr:hypothetical protein [Sporosarcina sp. E16_8]MBO0586482.1 hypothetical protein [Sporosarcina sp. E16_8]